MTKIISRHTTAYAYYDELGRPFLGDRDPFLYRRLADNVIHQVTAGDTLQSLAYQYYAPLSEGHQSAAQLWWIIADFQFEPIHDPTIPLVLGSYVVLPSIETVQTQILTREVE